MKHQIRIRRDGFIECLGELPFKTVNQTRRRFSEILPRNPVKRLAFRLLRKLFGETGRVSDYTRSWVCVWKAEILLGPHKGETMESGLRCVLIDWEHEKFFLKKGMDL